jgi:hypothetical protein
MSRPLELLELAACEGGATKGYQRAGFRVTAVDLDGAALKRNPAEVTVEADALEYLAEHGYRFDVIHASFPCQSWAANGANPAAARWPDLITPGRALQWAGVYGGARADKTEARTVRRGGYVPPDPAVQSDLLGGVPWMTGKGRRECIPPIYAEHVGRQLLKHVPSLHWR